ncbi:MAG: rhodanese-like domain-containing protein [Candidatus Aminicenantes bacterium]|nr:rhodanese-like domain-containing protein [Candidatus Aminicenantes bacterium]
MRKRLYVIFAAAIFILVACGQKTQKLEQIDRAEIIRLALDNYLTTTPENWRIVKNTWLKEKLDKKDTGDIFILDIRDPEDFQKEHIQGAVNIPFKVLAKEENLKKLPKDKTIVIVCVTGHSASMANVVLNLLGYKADTMKYGVNGWKEAGFPVVK